MRPSLYGAHLNGSSDQGAEELELQEMVVDQQRQISVTKKHRNEGKTRWSSTVLISKTKVFYTVLTLTVIVSATIGILAFMSHRVPSMSDIVTDRVQDEIRTARYQTNGNSDEINDGEAIPQLRSYTRHERLRSPERVGHMDIFIQKDKHHPFRRQSFPAAHYRRRHNPFRGSLLSFMPWVPIFADRRTRQTVIFSQTGGVYILPPVINMYGKMFSVAELIASGYASLVSSGVPPTAHLDMFRFFHPQPVLGPAVPVFNSYTGVFRGSIRSDIDTIVVSKGHEAHLQHEHSSESDEEDEQERNTDDYHGDHGNRRYGHRQQSDEDDLPPRKPAKHSKTTTVTTTTATATTTKTASTHRTSTTTTTITTTKTTTKTTEEPEPVEPILTRCQSEDQSSAGRLNAKYRSHSERKQHLKETWRKIRKTRGNGGKRMKNVFVVRFAPGKSRHSPFQRVVSTLCGDAGAPSSCVEKRMETDGQSLSLASFSVDDESIVPALFDHEDVEDIGVVEHVSRPKGLHFRTLSTAINSDDLQRILPHHVSGVAEVHRRMKNYGKGVRIAIIDDGIDYNHPAFGSCFKTKGCKIEGGYDFVGDDYDGFNTPMSDDDPFDGCSNSGYGTHLAGIIAGNSSGVTDEFYKPVTPFLGVAPEATLLIYRVFGCSGDSGIDVIAAAIQRAYEDKADIIMLAFDGKDAYSLTLIEAMVEHVTSMGVYVTIAGGFEGDAGLFTTSLPAILPNAISVASMDNAYTLKHPIITPDGKKIYYLAHRPFSTGEPAFAAKIVIDDPDQRANNGGLFRQEEVAGAVVVFTFNRTDFSSFIYGCVYALRAGATGCLLDHPYFSEIPTSARIGIINHEDKLEIAAVLNSQAGALFQFPDVNEGVPMRTALAPSFYTALGLATELDFKPDIGAIGGYVYSTISTARAQSKKYPSAYAVFSGTGAACPYLAGVLALFLNQIGNPAPNTVNGTAHNGICRPHVTLVRDLFQSTAKIISEYSTSLDASTVRQGAGLVDAYKGLTTKALFSPAKLALNDTVRQRPFYTVQLYNLGHRSARYQLSHRGAALATGKVPNNDLLIQFPNYSADYALRYYSEISYDEKASLSVDEQWRVAYTPEKTRNDASFTLFQRVDIEPADFTVRPGRSQQITLRFHAPVDADASLLPIYSGFIVAKEQSTGETTHLSYAGMVGNYGQARILVRQTPSGIVNGIKDANGIYVNDSIVPTLNATEGTTIVYVFAYATRIFYIQAIPAEDDVVRGYDIDYGLLESDGPFYLLNIVRNADINGETSYSNSYQYPWLGKIVNKFTITKNMDEITTDDLPSGIYRLRFMALKSFGDYRKRDDFDEYITPRFNLVY